jgi:hypothetical protein
VPPLIGPPSSLPMFWPVDPLALVDELPGSQPSLPLPRPALQRTFFSGGGEQSSPAAAIAGASPSPSSSDRRGGDPALYVSILLSSPFCRAFE